MENLPKTAWRPTAPLQIGEFRLDPTSNELVKAGQTTRLRPILMDVLLRLAVDAGTVVSRDSLLADVWPRRMVNDEVLSRAVAELRTALGDDPKSPRYIETLPKVGYRMVATVVTLDADVTAAAAMGAAPATTGDRDGGQTDDAPPAATAIANEPTPEPTDGGAVAAELARPGASPSPWKLIRMPLLALVTLAAAASWLQWRPAPGPVDRTALERQINAAVPFATSPDSESNPRFAADSRSIAFARNSAERSEIVMQDVASGQQTAFSLPEARVASPVWFDDGRRIAYWMRRLRPQPGQPDCAIMARELASGRDTVLVDCAQRPQPVFDVAPDGSALVYSALPRADLPLALMWRPLSPSVLADGGSAASRQLTSPAPGDGHDAYPRMSPDGRTLAFFRGTQSHVRLWTLALPPAQSPAQWPANTPLPTPKPASALEGLSYGVTWGPGPDQLIVAADWLGFRALNLVSLNDGSSQLLGARGARFPDLGRNGELVFESATFRADLWLSAADRPGEAPSVLWPSTRYSNQPEFSPDGRQIAFASNRSGSDSIHVGSIGSDALQRLPLAADARYIQPHWSPDGREIVAVRIAVTAAKPADQHAVRVNIATGEVKVLGALGNKVNNAVPITGPGGKGMALIYGELAEHAMRLYRTDADGSSPTRLPLPLVSSFAIAGNDLVYTQPQLSGATRCRLDTLACAPIDVPLDDGNRFDWTLGPSTLWYVGRDPAGKPALMRFDLDNGQRSSFAFVPSAAGTNIAVSRDGKQLVVSREAPAVVDLMIAKAVKAQ